MQGPAPGEGRQGRVPRQPEEPHPLDPPPFLQGQGTGLAGDPGDRDAVAATVDLPLDERGSSTQERPSYSDLRPKWTRAANQHPLARIHR